MFIARSSIFLSAGLIIFSIIGSTHSATATTDRSGWTYPIGIWNITLYHGEEIEPGIYHMGIDSGEPIVSAGEPIYAIGPGTVVNVQEYSDFGLVVLIEHTLPNGKPGVSLYGHLDPRYRLVTEGEVVATGQEIGVLGNKKNNGGWPPHTHFGIHKGAYDGTWVYYGHVRDPKIAHDWYDPEAFLKQYATPRLSTHEQYQGIALQRSDDSNPLRLRSFTTHGLQNESFRETVETTVPSAADITTARLTDPSQEQAVIVRNQDHQTIVHVLTSTGAVQSSFVAFDRAQRHGARLSAADVTGDGLDELIVGTGTGVRARVRVFNASGEQLQEIIPFKTYQQGVDVAGGDLNGDGKAELIIGQRKGKSRVVVVGHTGRVLKKFLPFGSRYRSGVNVAAGDIDGDGTADLIVGTDGDRIAQVRAWISTKHNASIQLQRVQKIYPFGSAVTTGVDVAAGDWDGDGKAEIMTSLTDQGALQVKAYQNDTAQTVLFDQPLSTTTYDRGSRIAGWQVKL